MSDFDFLDAAIFALGIVIAVCLIGMFVSMYV